MRGALGLLALAFCASAHAALTLVGTATASATTVTCPAHQAGDLLLFWAVRGNSTGAPSLPSGNISILTQTRSGTPAAAARLGYKIATGTSDASGTWTNASELICTVYRAPAGYTVGIGTSASSSSTTATITYPALTLADTTGNSWVAGFVGASNLTQSIATAPTGMTNESSVAGASYAAAGHDTEGGVSSWSVQTVASGATGNSVSATVEIMELPDGSAISQLYQYVVGDNETPADGNTPSGNSFKLPLPNATGAGNCLVLGISYPNSATLSSVSDNINGTWPAASVTADGGSGNMVSSIFVFPNSAAGQITITVTFSAAVVGFEWSAAEFDGIATTSPVSGTTSAAATSGPTVAAGSFTPSNNDANGGNLIWVYSYAGVAGDSGANAQSIRAAAPLQLIGADISWPGTNANHGSNRATAAYLQATSAAINPTISMIGTSATFNIAAVALKISSGAGTAPGAGIRMAGMQHFGTGVYPGSGTYALQIPSTSAFRLINSVDPNLNATTVTDSEGNTWTADGAGAGFWYLKGAQFNANLTVYITGGGGDGQLSWRYRDITGADATSPFDSAVLVTDSSTGTTYTPSNQPTPTNSNGLIVADIGLGQGPGKSVTAPAGAVWDLTTYTGETDNDTGENADIASHYHNTASGSVTHTYAVTNNTSVSGGFFSIKASTGASCTHNGYTSAGASALPNGTSGSYWGKSGAFVTPDCSTIQYWQPTQGNFGTSDLSSEWLDRRRQANDDAYLREAA